MAEAIFRKKASERDTAITFHIDSCGLGSWHVGEAPHPLTRKVLRAHKITPDGMRARQVKEEDFFRFQYLFAMDEDNLVALQAAQPEDSSAKIQLLRHYDPQADSLSVPDPYGEGDSRFLEVFEIVDRCCEQLLQTLLDKS